MFCDAKKVKISQRHKWTQRTNAEEGESSCTLARNHSQQTLHLSSFTKAACKDGSLTNIRTSTYTFVLMHWKKEETTCLAY